MLQPDWFEREQLHDAAADGDRVKQFLADGLTSPKRAAQARAV